MPSLTDCLPALRSKLPAEDITAIEKLMAEGKSDREIVDSLYSDAREGVDEAKTLIDEAAKKDGRAFSDFFDSVTEGAVGKASLSNKYEPVVWAVQKQINDPNSNLGRYHAEYQKHEGNFDQHIALSIPGYREFQYIIGDALVESYKDRKRPAVMLDIGASEGTQAKTITSLSGGKIKTIALDPSGKMQKTFNTTSHVPGASFMLAAFPMSKADEGTVIEDWIDSETGKPVVNAKFGKKKFDIIQESMVFQFINNERDVHVARVARVAELLKPNGLAIFQEKFKTDNWEQNEKDKNQYKAKSFKKEDLDAKAAEVLEGMNKNMVPDAEFEKILSKNFKHWTQMWDSGNFKGYAASNSEKTLTRFVNNMEDTTSPFDTRKPPIVRNGMVHLTHFSRKEGLKYLDPAFYGTGFKGAERFRMYDDSWLPRTYFGVDTGTKKGYRKEHSLGDVRYDVWIPIEELYDFDNDPDNLKATIKESTRPKTWANYENGVKAENDSFISRYEKAIYDAGYKGYYTQSPMGTTAAVFEKTPLTLGQNTGPHAPPRHTKWSKWKPEKTSTGKIKGAPEWVKSDKDLAKLTRRLKRFTQEGVVGRYWYEDSARAILKIVNGDVHEAERFIQIIAIYSPQVTVSTNLSFAIRAWNQYKNGEPIKVKTAAQDAKATDVLYHNKPFEGRKTNSFYQNLMYEIVRTHPEEFDDEVSRVTTIDLWMMRAFGYEKNVDPGDDKGTGAYSFAENYLRKITDQLNEASEKPWTPHQVQAAIWTAMKTRYEIPWVKEKTWRKSIKAGYARIENGRRVLPTDTETLRKHRKIWHDVAMSVTSDEVKREAKANAASFKEFIDRATEVITFETIPAPSYQDASVQKALQKRFTDEAVKLILDDGGNDILANKLGVPLAFVGRGEGAYMGEVTPNVLAHIVPTKLKGDFSRDEARAYARAVQYIYRQEAVPWFRNDPVIDRTESGRKKLRYKVVTPTGRTIASFDRYDDAVARAGDKYKVVGGEYAKGVTLQFKNVPSYDKIPFDFTRTNDNEITIVNFRGENNLPEISDEDFLAQIDDLAEELGAIDVIEYWVEGEYGYEHDWSKSPEGEEILTQEGIAERSDLHSWIRDRRKAYDELLSRYQTPAPKEELKIFNQSAWHGTPHTVNRFDTRYIGTGEGNQAYGWGLYFASNKKVAEWYKEALTKTNIVTFRGTPIDDIENSALRTYLNEYVTSVKVLNRDTDEVKREIVDILQSQIEDFKQMIGTLPDQFVQSQIDRNKEAVDIIESIKDGDIEPIETKGKLYKVELAPKDEELLNWDTEITEQSDIVKEAVPKITGKPLAYLEGLRMTGAEIYGMISRKLGGDKIASLTLREHGVRGIKYFDGMSRTRGQGYYNYVIFDGTDVDIIDQFEQFQRGRIYLTDAKRVVQLTEKSDLSTFLHETGHLFLDMQAMWAKKYGMTDNQKAILDWLEIEDWSQITEEHHEKWAETFEVYLRTGEAPSLKLRRAFMAFARWLKIIYRQLTDPRLRRAQFDDEVKGIFDRLLATQDEIEEASANPAYEQFFRSKEQAGMTDAEWKKYQERVARVKGDAEMTVDEKILRDYMKMKTKEWEKAKEPLVEEAKEKLSKLPIYQLMNNLKVVKDENGKKVADGRLNSARVKEIYDGVIPPKLLRFVSKDGIDPDLYAEGYGYPSSKEMLDTLQVTPSITKAAEAAAQDEMIKRHGDILNDGTLEQEVREAFVNEEQAALLEMEIKVATRRKSPINRNYLKAEAKRIIGSMKYKEIQPNRYYQAMIRAAQNAARTRDPQDKIQQLVNHYLYKEALAVKSKMTKNRRFVRSAQNRKYDTKKVDPYYVQQIKMLADMYEMRQSPEQIVALQSILEFYIGQKAKGVDVSLLDPNLVRALEYKEEHNESLEGFKLVQFDDLSSEELQGVVDMLRHIRFVGGQMAEMNGDEAIKERVEFIKSARENGGKDHPIQRGHIRSFESVRRSWNHLVNLMPSLMNLIRKIDGMKDGGVAFKLIYKRIHDAESKELEMNKKFYEQFDELTSSIPDVHLSRRDAQRFDLENGESVEFTSEERFMIGLYWGTQSSREAIMQAWSMTENDIVNILGTLTEDQLKLMNAIWEMNESQWPDLRDAAIEMMGVAPPKLDPTPFTINGVELTGGHMQLFYDSQRVELKNEREQASHTMSIIPNKAGTLNARVGSGGMPPLLDIANITRSIEEKIHYIAYAKVGRELRRLVNHPEVKAVIERKHGPGFYTALIETIDGITSGRAAQETAKPLAKLSRHIRSSATLMHLAYSIRNTVQQIGALPIAAREVGLIQFIQSSAQLLGNKGEMVSMIHEKSKFMENRAQIINREAREAIKNVISTSKVGKSWNDLKSHAFIFQTMMDSTIAYPTWLATYNKALEEHGDEKRAVIEADTTVAESVGSGSDLHLGRIMQSSQNEYVKTLTMFGSWFNAYYQRLYRSSKGGADFANADFVIDAFILPFIVANISQLLILDTPDDDEGVWEYLFGNTAKFLLSTVPVIREMQTYIMGYIPSQPVSTVVGAPVRIVNELKSGEEGRQTLLKTVTDIGRAITSVVKAPGSGQLWRLLDYTDSYLEGNEGDVYNPYQALVEGRNKE